MRRTSAPVLVTSAFVVLTACAGSSAHQAGSMVSALSSSPSPEAQVAPLPEPGSAAVKRACTLEDLIAAGYQQETVAIDVWLAERCVPADQDTFVLGLLAGATPEATASSVLP